MRSLTVVIVVIATAMLSLIQKGVPRATESTESSPSDCSCPDVEYRCEQAVCSPPCVHGICGPDSSGSPVCHCAGGWTGDRCDEALCIPACQNGGFCIFPGLCACPVGWEGASCNKPICDPECVHGTCGTDSDETHVCKCAGGWEGERCDEALCIPACQNGGFCIFPGQCACPVGWEGASCNKPICDHECVHGTCGTDSNGTHVCHCAGDWMGERCDQAICKPEGCLNGGECISPGHCSCRHGFSGSRCQDEECSVPCVHGDCYDGDKCNCDQGWEGEYCNEAACFPPCQNGGFCILPFLCYCVPPYAGFRCETLTTNRD